MEITHDIYAWLVACGIIDTAKSMKTSKTHLIVLNDDVIDKFKNADIDKLVLKLEDLYNKFYKSKLNYSEKLHDLKKDNVSTNSIRISNWKILSNILNNFGLDIYEDTYTKIISGDVPTLNDFLSTLHTLFEALTNRMSLIGNENKNEVGKEEEALLQKKNNQSDTIELNHINEGKDLSKAETLLEFFLISLCKPLNIKIRQAAGLLSENRKYLIQVCNKGIKGDYSRIINWYNLLSFNERHLNSLVKASKAEGKTMTYATISCGLYSKSYQVAASALSFLNQLVNDIGTDHEWFFREGLNALLYSAMTHNDIILSSLNLMESFAKNRISDICKEIGRRYISDREALLDLFESILEKLNKCNINIYQQFKAFIFEVTLNENKERGKAVSLLIDAWITFQNDIDENTKAQIISYINKCLKDSTQRTVQMIALTQGFRLMNFLGKIKEENAPKLYKFFVFRIQENFEDSYYREASLINFLNAFSNDQNIPIEIMLKPYLQQMLIPKSLEKINTFDLAFIDKITKYPRFNQEFMYSIIELYFSLFLNYQQYSRYAHEKINEFIDKGMLLEEHYDLCVKFIKSSIKAFIRKPADCYIMNLSFELINLKINKINSKLEKDVIEANKYFRAENNTYSSSLLSMLWFYDSHDDVIMCLEEKYSKRYDPVIKTVINVNSIREVTNKPKDYLLFIKKKKELEEQLKKEKEEKEKIIKHKKEEELKKKLQERALEVVKKKRNSIEDSSKQANDNNFKEIIENKQSKYVKENSINNNIQVNNVFLTSNIPNNKIVFHPLIKEENTIIDNTLNFNISLIDKNKFILSKEENREKIAIDALTKQYNKNTWYYFNKYLSDIKKKEINRPNILRFIRDLGFTDSLLNLEEMSNAIRTQFDYPILNFSFDQFVNFLVVIANIIFSKIDKTNTVSQNFESILKLMFIPHSFTLTKPQEKIKDVLNQKLINSTGSGIISLPPGFAIKEASKLDYSYTTNKDFIAKFLKESQIISIDILEEIISKITKSHIVEPFINIKINKEIQVTDTIPKWPYSIFNSSLKSLPEEVITIKEMKDNQAHIEIIGNLLNDILKALDLGKTSLDKSFLIIPRGAEKEFNTSLEQLSITEINKEQKRRLRNQFLKKELQESKQKAEELKLQKADETKKQKELEKKQLEDKLFKEKEEKIRIKNELLEKKKMRKEEEVKKIRENREIEEKQKKELKEKEDVFLKEQKVKLKNQFKFIKEKNELLQIINIEAYNQQIPKVEIQKVFSKKASFYKFDSQLNETIEGLLSKNDISDVFNLYESHIKTIFQVYSTISNNKFNFTCSENTIREKEFKEFVNDFSLSGLFVTIDQVAYIFKKLSKRNNGEKEDIFFLKYNDFKLALIYLLIYSKYVPKGKYDINQEMINKVNSNSLTSLFELLNLQLPFYKLEVEQLITELRSLSAKDKLTNQIKFKKEKYDQYVEAEKPARIKKLKKIKKEPSQNEVKYELLMKEAKSKSPIKDKSSDEKNNSINSNKDIVKDNKSVKTATKSDKSNKILKKIDTKDSKTNKESTKDKDIKSTKEVKEVKATKDNKGSKAPPTTVKPKK